MAVDDDIRRYLDEMPALVQNVRQRGYARAAALERLAPILLQNGRQGCCTGGGFTLTSTYDGAPTTGTWEVRKVGEAWEVIAGHEEPHYYRSAYSAAKAVLDLADDVHVDGQGPLWEPTS